MKAYSLDFRQKIIEVYEQECPSQRELAKRFRVATSFIIKLLKQYRDGDIAPKAHGGGSPAKLAAHEALIVELVEANNHATLDELCDQVAERVEVRVSRATMGRTVQQLNLTRKKNVSRDRTGQRARAASPSRVLATHGGR
jgi:transposase